MAASIGDRVLALQADGRDEESVAAAEEAEAIFEQIGDAVGVVTAQANRALLLHRLHRTAEARALIARARGAAEEHGFTDLRHRIQAISQRIDRRQ